MFTTYLLPVTTAISMFPLIALLVMLPAAFVSYRRRGRAGGWTTLIFYAMLFYLLAALMQTVVPLPRDPSAYCATQTYASTPQLRPFYFIEVIENRARGRWSVGAILRNPAIWSTALNVVLLLPLGIFLRYFLRQRALVSTAIGFGVSLLFELTQLTGLWFIYPCAYRLFSVDDLILNTAGVMIGWLVAGPLIRILPALEPERDRRAYAARVTFTRRLFALATDIIGFAVTVGFCLGLLTLFGSQAAKSELTLPVVLIAVGWFVVVPLFTGCTLGKWAMLLRIRRVNGRRAGPISLLVRYGVLLSPLWLLWLSRTFDEWGSGDNVTRLLLTAAMFIAFVVVAIWSPLAAQWRADERTPYEWLSGTVNVAIVKDDAPLDTVPR